MLKTNLKNTLILSLIVALIASVCLFANTVFSVKADEECDYSFYLDGASIKILKDDYVGDGKDSGAIRFSLVMSKDYFDYDEESGYSLKDGFEDFGVLIIPSDVLGENELEYDTLKVAKFSFANVIGETAKAVAGRNQLRFNACIYNLPTSYYLKEFTAKGYVYDGTVYSYSDEMQRSIAQVAFLASNDGISGVSKYFDAVETGWTTTELDDDDDKYVAYSDYGTATYGEDYTYSFDGEDTITDVRLNGRSLAFTQSVSAGVTTVTVDSEVMAAANIREENKFVFFFDSGAYTYNADSLYTAELSDEADVEAMLAGMKSITTGTAPNYVLNDAFVGRYKLTADVDFENANINPTSATCKTMVSYTSEFNPEWYNRDGFQAIFDGDGYAIKNVELSWRTYNGFFGEIGLNGVVKNLSLVNFHMTGNNGMLACQNYGVVTDCFVSGYFVDDRNKDTADASTFLVGLNYGEISNCLVVDNNADLKTISAAFVSKNYGDISDCYIVTEQEAVAYGFAYRYEKVGTAWENLGLFKMGETETPTAQSSVSTSIIGGLPLAFYNNVYVVDGDYRVSDVSAVANCGKLSAITDITDEFDGGAMFSRNGGHYYWGKLEIFTDSRLLETQDVGEIVIGKLSVVSIDELKDDIITSVKVGGVEVFSSQSGASVTLDGAAISTSSKSADIVIETETAIYDGKIVVVKEIGTTAAFTSMLSDAKTAMNNVGGYTGYYRLTANLDFSSLTAGNWNTYTMYNSIPNQRDSGKFWQAVFDGNGYSLRNITLGAGDKKGLFGVIGVNGIIKNLSVFNLSVGSNSGGLCYINFGTIENVYVEYKYSYASASSVLGSFAAITEGGSKFVNCVAVDNSTATYNGAGLMIGWARNVEATGDITITNCYAVKNSYSAGYNVIANNAISADISDVTVVTSMGDFISAASGLDLLDVSTYEKKWGEVTIYEEITELGATVDILAAGETVTISDLVDGETLVSATIGGTAVSVENSGDSVTFGSFGTVGEQELILVGEKEKYVGTVRVVTAYIASATDFNAMLASKQAASTTTGFTGYYLLTANITSGVVNTNMLGAQANPKFNATFDGNGYSISSPITISTAGGAIFGSLGNSGVIKNLAVTDVTIGIGTAGALTFNCYGTIENVYVKVNFAQKASAPFAYIGQSGCTIKNCVANVGNPSNSAVLFIYQYNANVTVDNCVILTNSGSSGAPLVKTPGSYSATAGEIQVSYMANFNVGTLYTDTNLTLVSQIAMLSKVDNVIYWGKTRLN